jgi:iron complex transport system ATP-binding protein
LIRLENASFSYDGKNYLFRELGFRAGKGEVLAVLGANGIGKTTLFRCLLGFLRFHTGELYIGNEHCRRMKETEFWRLVGYVPQAKGFIFDYTVLNMVVMGRSNSIGFGQVPKKEDYEASLAILERMGLADLAGRSCGSLSGGQLQLVLIARALVKKPEILIMDEPESHLDMKNQLKVLNLIDELAHRDHFTVIINTHFPAHALRCADKTLMLGKDTWVFGDSQSIITAENIERYFGVHAKVLAFEEQAREFRGIIPFALKEPFTALPREAAERA